MKQNQLIALALYRQQPVKGSHAGRGMAHSEKCYRTCFDSWLHCVNATADVLYPNGLTPNPKREAWLKQAHGSGVERNAECEVR